MKKRFLSFKKSGGVFFFGSSSTTLRYCCFVTSAFMAVQQAALLLLLLLNRLPSCRWLAAASDRCVEMIAERDSSLNLSFSVIEGCSTLTLRSSG